MKFSSVIDSIRGYVSSTLGQEWNRLSHVYDVTKNDNFTIQKGYGVRSLSATEIDDLLCNNVSLEHGIEIILTDNFIAGDDDSDLEGQIKALQDKVEELYRGLVYKKIDGNVILANQLEVAEPEILEDNSSIVQRFSVVIRYRVNLT